MDEYLDNSGTIEEDINNKPILDAINQEVYNYIRGLNVYKIAAQKYGELRNLND